MGMARQTFTWYPDVASQQEQTPGVTATKFGEYEQRVAVGLNNNPKKWSVSFERDRAQALAVLTFLRARNGIETFYWTDPEGETGVYLCKSWSNNMPAGFVSVKATFEQRYEF